MSEIRRTEPTQITQGERLHWEREFDDHPATEWTLEYRFRGNGTGFDEACTADGVRFIADIPESATADMDPGKYIWQAWATEIADATNSEMIATDSVVVKAGFVHGATTAVDLRSNAKKTLDAINEALLTASSTANVIEYEITTPAGNRHVKYATRADLLGIRKTYAGIVSRENAAERVKNGKPLAQQVKIVMRERG